MKKRKEKIGIIVTGGGMRCAYSAGALTALAEEFKLTEPHALAAESGGVGNAYYFLAKQFSNARPAWTEHLADKEVVEHYTHLNVDYIVDTIFKKKIPLDLKAVSKTKIQYFFSVTDAKTGKTVYINNKSPFDPYEVMRAAKAVPIVYGKKVRLGLKKFIDGGISDNIADMAKNVLATGVTTLITLNNEPAERAKIVHAVLGLNARRYPKGLRDALLHDLSVPQGLCPAGGSARAICITPSKPLMKNMLGNSKKDLTFAFELGYSDVVGNPALRKLFHEINSRK